MKKRATADQKFCYEVSVTGWSAYVYFNEYASINIFDDEPYQDRYYMCLYGFLTSSMSKKVKTGQKVKVVIHPGEFKDYNVDRYGLEPIGDMEMTTMTNDDGEKEKILMYRISVPVTSFNHIRAAMTGSTAATISLTGTEISYRKGQIFHLTFQSTSNLPSIV